MSPPISRRRLVYLGGAGVVTAAAALLIGRPEPDPVGEGLAAELLAGLTHPQGAALIGVVWLGDGLAGGSPSAQARTVAARLRPHGWRPGAGAEALRAAVGESVRADFTRGETVGVDGWQLARTSAELCALAALASGPAGPVG